MVRKEKYQLFGRLRKEEYAALEADILKRGVQVAVELDEKGNVLDGHHRKEIADKHGLEYETVVKEFETEQEKREHVLKVNLARRHLEPYEWGSAFKMLLKERGVERKPGAPCKGGNSATVAQLSEELGVPIRTAQTRMKASDDYESFNVKQQEAVHENETSIPKVKKAKRRTSTQAKEATARKVAEKNDGNPWEVTASQRVVQCQAMVTDPPYGILDEPWEPDKLESFTRKWATRWAKCGADLMAIFWSQAHLWDGAAWFDECLDGYTFQQLLVWHYPNNKSPQSRQMFKQTWEPVFLYRKDGCEREIKIGGGNDGQWGGDLTDFDCHVAAVPQTNFNDENMKQHPAQKPVSAMRWLVNALTDPGELVVDPFCGSGTTGIAAVQLGRRFHGIEIDEEFRTTAQGRIAKYGTETV